MGAPRVTARRLAGGAAAVLACLLATGTAAADSVRDNEWVLAAVQAQDAWATTRGAGVTVAVLDSGIDPGHMDLTGQVTTGPDFVGGDARPGDPYWGQHGTSMASTIAGHGHGPGLSAGVIGVAPDARILSVRVTWDNNDPIRNLSSAGQSAAGAKPGNPVAEGIRYAVDQGAQVINMSFGEAASSSTRVAEMDAAIEYAIAHGVVMVASTGNGAQSDNDTEYPAAFPGVIGVAATDRSGHRATFSTHRWTSSVAAPGVEVLEAQAGGGYVIGDGTSPAAALVSGVAALIRSRYPRLTPAQVRAVLERTALHPAGGYTEDVGWGVVQADAALKLAATLTPDALTPAPAPRASHTRHLGAGGVPRVGLDAIEGRAVLASLGLPVGGLLLTAAVLLATVRRWPWPTRRRIARYGPD